MPIGECHAEGGLLSFEFYAIFILHNAIVDIRRVATLHETARNHFWEAGMLMEARHASGCSASFAE